MTDLSLGQNFNIFGWFSSNQKSGYQTDTNKSTIVSSIVTTKNLVTASYIAKRNDLRWATDAAADKASA